MRIFVLILVALSTMSCLRKHAVTTFPDPQPMPLDIYKDEPAQRAPGSLYDTRGGNAALISDARAYRLNDIVIIRIAENMSATNSADTTGERETTHSLKLPSVFGADLSSLTGTATDGTVLSTETVNEHEGRGTTGRTNVFSGTVAARVIEVLPNGYLMLQGQKTVAVNDERVQFFLTGLVNPLMINSDHSVLSSQVADMKLNYGGKGVVSMQQNPGLFSRIINWLWPF